MLKDSKPEMTYPGQVKLTVIREKEHVELREVDFRL